MKSSYRKNVIRSSRRSLSLLLSLLLCACAPNHSSIDAERNKVVALYAKRVFDGQRLLTDTVVVVNNGRIEHVGPLASIDTRKVKLMDLGDSTLLPGLIESHAHLTYKKVPEEVVLRHGITTLRDLGGPVHHTRGGDGRLRMLTSGPILTAPNGYPISLLGAKNIAIPVASEKEARKTVTRLIDQGAAVIKIALEPGGEQGAPWSNHLHHAAPSVSGSHTQEQTQPWPMLSLATVEAIVEEAHRHNKTVSAHIGEASGAKLALQAGVDEWSHVPCDQIPDNLLKQAAAQHVTVISTIDTLSKCHGVRHNLQKLKQYGATIIYGTEIAHPDIPWGIDSQELIYLQHYAGMNVWDILASATSKAAQNLNMSTLGVIKNGAVADIIAVKDNPLHNLKILEYPDFVMAGGKIVVNNYAH